MKSVNTPPGVGEGQSSDMTRSQHIYGGIEHKRLDGDGELLYSPQCLLCEIQRLRSLLKDVGESGVAFEDARISYVEVQIDVDTWKEARAIASESERATDV